MGRLEPPPEGGMHRRGSSAELPKGGLVAPVVKPKSAFDPFKYRAYKMMHKQATPSLLSSESPKQNYRGFLNLLLIVFCVLNVR